MESTQDVEQTRCDTNRCPGCAERRAFKIQLAIVSAAPTHWVTLTLAGTDWRAANRRWAALRRQLAKKYEFQAAYVVELGSAGDELHLHVLWRGQVPPSSVLAERAHAVGLGRQVHVDRLFDVPGAAAYLTKQVREGLSAVHVEVNGGRLIHATSGFWELDGEAYPGGWSGVAKALRRRARRR